jgi:hypothetical protein
MNWQNPGLLRIRLGFDVTGLRLRPLSGSAPARREPPTDCLTAAEFRPRLNPHYVFRGEASQDAHILLYPEG